MLCLGMLPADMAFAHGVEGGFVLLLPTGYYMLGAALSVAVTFLLLSLRPGHLPGTLYGRVLTSPAFRVPSGLWPATLGSVVLALMVLAGLFGSRDPLQNPLPAFVWTLFWVCFTLLQGLLGPLWRILNPWRAPVFLIERLTGQKPRVRLPARIGYGIAILQFYGFAWFELVDIAPSDPQRLAMAVGFYWLFNLTGMVLVGETDWRMRAEPFSIFFSLIGRLAPIDWQRSSDGKLRVRFGFPGWNLVHQAPLPASGIAFILLTLSAVSFDGLSRSFIWLSAIGINPLAYPGRSAVVLSSSLGILVIFLIMAALYTGSIWLGCRLAGEARVALVAGRLVYSIIPISLAFQFSHYLTSVLVEGQNFLRAISDPFARGVDLFGTAHLHVTASFLNVFHLVALIFNIQTLVIVVAHALAVVMAHGMLSALPDAPKRAFRLELPFAALMVAYTAFGLWLLSIPRI